MNNHVVQLLTRVYMELHPKQHEIDTGTGEKGTICDPCLHHRHNECEPKVKCVCKSRGHNPS